MSSMNPPSPLKLTLGAAPAPAPAAETAAVRPEHVAIVRVAKPADKRGWWWGTGRRKTAVARVRLKPATGDAATVRIISTSDRLREIDDFFTEDRDRVDCIAPLQLAGLLGKVQVVAKIQGGGIMGQAQAMRLGIARALVDWDPNLYKSFRDADFLTRDARKVERKKYGQAGARRRFQFSKR
jgi:small subunit ribosomal protein S9